MPRHFYKKRKGEDRTTRVSSSNSIWGSPLGILPEVTLPSLRALFFSLPFSIRHQHCWLSLKWSSGHRPSIGLPIAQLFASQSGGDPQGTPDSCSIIISSFSRGCWSHEEESWPLDSSLSVSLPDPCFSFSANLEAGTEAPASVPFHSCPFPSSWLTQTLSLLGWVEEIVSWEVSAKASDSNC